MAEHTPLFWTYEPHGNDSYDIWERSSNTRLWIGEVAEEEKAALIVKACNLHERLVEALGEYLNWHEINFMLPSGNFEDPDQQTLAREARALLAEAEKDDG